MILEMSYLSTFFERRSSVLSWKKSDIIYKGKRSTVFPNIQKIYFHVFLFWKRFIFHFLSKEEEYQIFGKKKYYLPWWHKKYHIPVHLFWQDHFFKTFAEKIIFSFFFLLWKRSAFIFRLKNKIIFSRKRNIFPVNTGKIIFQCNFFSKDHLFRTFIKRNNGYLSSDEAVSQISMSPTF